MKGKAIAVGILAILTRQLEQSQRLLEHHQEPWYRRVKRGKT